MAKFTREGTVYVDSYYGDDTNGTGTKERPFKSINRAWSVGSIIVLRGYFSETLPATTGNRQFLGDGLAIIDGAGVPDGSYLMNGASPVSRVENIRFINWNGSRRVISSRRQTPVAMLNCSFHYCNYYTGQISGEVAFNAVGCIFNECFFGAGGASNMGEISNCTFTNCSGSLGSFATQFLFKNNAVHNCNGLSCAFPTVRPGGSEFNYCNISGGFSTRTLAQWQAFGDGSYLANGFEVPTAEVFNDYVPGRDALNSWQQDFTMRPTCILRDAASDGLEIGAKRTGYRFSADALWNTYKAASTNLTYSLARGLMLLDPLQGQGTYESVWLPIGTSIQLDMANLQAAFVVENGDAVQFLGSRPEAPNTALNQRRAFDFQLAVADSAAAVPDWKTQEFYQKVRLDGSGRGVADPNYTPTVVQIPKGSFLKIKFQMNNLAIAV